MISSPGCVHYFAFSPANKRRRLKDCETRSPSPVPTIQNQEFFISPRHAHLHCPRLLWHRLVNPSTWRKIVRTCSRDWQMPQSMIRRRQKRCEPETILEQYRSRATSMTCLIRRHHRKPFPAPTTKRPLPFPCRTKHQLRGMIRRLLFETP